MTKCYLDHEIQAGQKTCPHGHGTAAPAHSAAASQPGNENVTIPANMLQQLINVVQAAQGNQGKASNVEKPKRPTISSGFSSERWTYFLSRWSQYKIMTALNNTNSVGQLLECCDEELRLDLHRSVGSQITNMTEANVLAEIKNLAVKEENILVSRIALRGMVQGPDEDVKHFSARIKGQANTCKYTVRCTRTGCGTEISYAESEIKDQLCKGLADLEIQQELLSHSNQNMSLHDVTNFIAAKEAGKRSQTALIQPATINKISQYQKNKSSARSTENPKSKKDFCGWCGETGHGAKANYERRKQLCPAFGKKCPNCKIVGHIAKMCRQEATNRSSANCIDDNIDTTNDVFIGSINSKSSITEVKNFNGRFLRIPHSEYDDMKGWVTKRSKDDPTVTVKLKTCEDGYKSLNLIPKLSKTITHTAIADTGARTTVAGMNLVRALGLTQADLIPVKLQLYGANGSNLNILGGIFLSITSKDANNKTWETKQLCYIQSDNAQRFYLSRVACEQLGIIHDTFPEIGTANSSSINTLQL